jgi:methanogenic corrinoid protein MtbC1
VFVDLLAPVARWMGEEWKEDRLSFIEVSMGLWRLQEVLRHISAGTSRDPGGQGTALFAAMPGDQHSFGTAMVHECFVIAGWDAELILEATRQQLVEAVATSRIDLIGLTISSDCPVERIASLIRAVRSVSMNPNLCVMIGGRLPMENPNLVALAGADATAATAPAAVKLANRIVGANQMSATG